MQPAPIKPDSTAIKQYHTILKEAERQHALHEGNVRGAFETLLRDTAKLRGWELVMEVSEPRGEHAIRYDGTVRDANRLPHGWWEAKDTRDDLDVEIRKKRERGLWQNRIQFYAERIDSIPTESFVLRVQAFVTRLSSSNYYFPIINCEKGQKVCSTKKTCSIFCGVSLFSIPIYHIQ
jgi:hypothetical protein